MIWALAGALAVGLSLGILGSGGSILTVPVLTYVVGQDEKVAIASSLAIVGVISMVAAIPYGFKRNLDGRSVLLFGLPGMAGSYMGAALSGFASGGFQLTVLAALMLVAAVFMFRQDKAVASSSSAKRSAVKIALDGLVVGTITGFVGVGGGFLIVPALVLLGGLPMSKAVGTSLVIIALKSATGFYKHLDVLADANLELDWKIIGAFCGIGVVGSLLGSALGSRASQATLRRGFAVFLVLTASYIVYRNAPALLTPPSNEAPSELSADAL